MTIDYKVLRKYKDKANIFVETGTHIGTTTKLAAKLGFSKIYTIELADHFYKQAVQTFRNNPNVIPIFGDTAEELPKLLESIDEPCLFWLDGHWSAGNTALGPVPVPLYQELEALAKHPIKTHTILIDDVRLMGDEWEDIDLEHVKELLLNINENYQFSFENGYVKDDILVATL